MDFDGWITEVKRLVTATRSDIRAEDVDPNAMYQAFSNGVAPETFATAPVVPVKTQAAPPKVAPTSPPKPPPVQLHVPQRPVLKAAQPTRNTQSLLDRLVIPLVVGTFLSILFLVWHNSDQSQQSSTNSSSSNLDYQPSAKPILAPRREPTEQENFNKAKAILASWKGDDDQYQTAIGCLGLIPDSSKLKAQRNELNRKWELRKNEADVNHAREWIRAGAMAERKQEYDAKVAARHQIRQEKADASSFSGAEDTQVAIYKVELHRSTENHTATGNGTHIYVLVAVKNSGTESIHANPNDFTLADSNGNTVSHDTDTYSLSNYFNAVDLSPGQQTSGWLVFYLAKDSKYVLTRHGGLSGSTVEKAVIP